MNQTTVGPADVTLSGGTYVRNAKLTMAKLTRLGNSPNAIVKVYEWDETNNRFIEFDKVTAATITTGKNKNTFTVVGASQQAMDEIAGWEEADVVATWEVKITGSCSDCG